MFKAWFESDEIQSSKTRLRAFYDKHAIFLAAHIKTNRFLSELSILGSSRDPPREDPGCVADFLLVSAGAVWFSTPETRVGPLSYFSYYSSANYSNPAEIYYERSPHCSETLSSMGQLKLDTEIVGEWPNIGTEEPSWSSVYASHGLKLHKTVYTRIAGFSEPNSGVLMCSMPAFTTVGTRPLTDLLESLAGASDSYMIISPRGELVASSDSALDNIIVGAVRGTNRLIRADNVTRVGEPFLSVARRMLETRCRPIAGDPYSSVDCTWPQATVTEVFASLVVVLVPVQDREAPGFDHILIGFMAQSEVEGPVRDARNSILWANGVSLLVNVLAVAVMLWWGTRFLTVFSRALHNAARMRNLSEIANNRRWSVVREVSAGFRSIRMLAATLDEFRGFLPSGVAEDSHFFDDGTTNNSPDQSVNPLSSQVSMLLHAVAPSGADVTIVFTDFEGSTTLWESIPHAMVTAYRTQQRVITQCIQACDGYLVKQIGDSFMVAFEKPLAGVLFGLDLHERMFAASWPDELNTQPESCHVKDTWHGLREKIGVHHGAVIVETNAKGESDYYGQTVNLASRIANACKPGAVCVTKATLRIVEGGLHGLPLPKRPLTTSMGDVELKGVSEKVQLVGLYPGRWPLRLELEGLGEGYSDSNGDSELSSGAKGTSDTPSPGHGKRRHRGELFGYAGRFRDSLRIVAAATAGNVAITHPRAFYDDSAALTATTNRLLSLITDRLHRTGGIVAYMAGTSVGVLWNVSRRCNHHLHQALAFGSLVFEVRPLHTTLNFGVATGNIFKGQVTGLAQRFVMMFGPCVTLARTLAEEARSLEARTLCASLDAQTSVAHAGRRSWRPVATLQCNGAAVEVFEYRTDASTPELDNSMTLEVPWGWTEGYWEAFEHADHATIARNAPWDAVLRNVVVRMQEAQRVTMLRRHHDNHAADHGVLHLSTLVAE
ncbi:Receptor-type adenylate cyclase GRESAG 4.2 [Diplonema papillatum]|nr:Receptor-type adenylate cyclase GRESAG 4.2 [Diplonema papillatum]